jgi:hypothetical protein
MMVPSYDQSHCDALPQRQKPRSLALFGAGTADATSATRQMRLEPVVKLFRKTCWVSRCCPHYLQNPAKLLPVECWAGIGENDPMCTPSRSKRLLPAQALAGLHGVKQQLLNATAGKIPEYLVLATVATAVRLARKEAAPHEVMSARVLDMVRLGLTSLVQKQGKPDTSLLLQKQFAGGGHGRPE